MAMRRFVGIGVIFGILLAGSASAEDKKEPGVKKAPLEVSRICKIDTPGLGFEWKLVQSSENKGTKVHVYVCKNEAGSAALSMTILEFTANTEGKRRGVLRAHWDALMSLKDKGYMEFKGEPPSFDAPIRNETFYSINGKDKNGEPKVDGTTANVFFDSFRHVGNLAELVKKK